MKWYSISTTYKSIHVDVPRKRHLWEHLVFLVRAPNEASAKKVALQVAEEKQHEYLASRGDVVRWVFQDVESIQEILDDEIHQGTEVFWEFYEKVDK